MSAAFQLPALWAQNTARQAWPGQNNGEPLRTQPELDFTEDEEEDSDRYRPSVSLAFYRKHAESMLRRYLYASMVVGRAPSIMDEPVRGGRATHQRVRTFEDAVIFVLDIENCLSKLTALDRLLISRVVLQEYTQQETAEMLGMSVRGVIYKLHHALDKVTGLLLDAGLLDLPQH